MPRMICKCPVGICGCQQDTVKPYTDADVRTVVHAIMNTPSLLAHEVAAAVLDALAAADRLAGSRPTPHLDTVKAQRDKLQDANDTLALTLAEAIGTLAPDGEGCSRGWIPRATVDRWRRALHEAEVARS